MTLLGLFMAESNTTFSIDSAADLVQAYASGHRNFKELNLVSADLSHADLKGADFSYVDFSQVNLSHANLRGADLSYANLYEADLTETDLRGAMLIGTDLRHAILESAKFDQADYDPEITQFPPNFDPVKAGMRADRKIGS